MSPFVLGLREGLEQLAVQSHISNGRTWPDEQSNESYDRGLNLAEKIAKAVSDERLSEIIEAMP